MLQLHVQIKAFSQSEEIKNKKFLCGCTHSSCTRAIPKRNEDTFSAKLSHRRTHEPLRARLPFFIHRESENRNRRQRAWWETRQAAPGVSGLRLTSCPSQRLVLLPLAGEQDNTWNTWSTDCSSGSTTHDRETRTPLPEMTA